jgi:signal transduction histidine kinase
VLQSAVVRLTISYLAIIMVLSIAFSFVLYNISSSELNRDFHRETAYFGNFGPPPNGLMSPDQFRIDAVNASLGRLRLNLLAFNLITLLLGGGASFMLARRTLRPIEEAMEAQSRFTADASHELRTPLTAIQTETEVALRDPKLSKAAAVELLSSNLEEVAKLRALADGLLRLASDDIEPEGKASLRVIAERGLDRQRKAIGAKHMQIENQVQDITVEGDEQQLGDLIGTLVDNAVKYSPAGSTITLSSRVAQRQAYISVADRGVGVKASDIPYLFNRFYRADSSRAKDRVAGYGLGLSIAQKIAVAHHGDIAVESTPGRGSTFTVQLPLAKA